jgi:hypothetical protein
VEPQSAWHRGWVDLNLSRAQHRTLALILSLRYVPLVRSNVTLDGSVIRKRHVITMKHDLDSATALRVVGDSHGGVVLQVHWGEHRRHYSLQLLKVDHLGMSAIPAASLEALANAIGVVDTRDALWPDEVGMRPGDRARKPVRLTRKSVEGRVDVAELLRVHAEYVRTHDDLALSPLAKMRFTSASIAAAMAEAYEPIAVVPSSEPTAASKFTPVA